MDKKTKTKLLKEFSSYCPNAFTWQHYNLAENTTIDDPQLWKEFITDPEISTWIREELNLIQTAELNKLLMDISNSHSVGQAQIISALSKLTESGENKKKKGPAYVYCYIPLNQQQEQAPNVIKLEEDPFLC